jgi:hypothetical protein
MSQGIGTFHLCVIRFTACFLNKQGSQQQYNADHPTNKFNFIEISIPEKSNQKCPTKDNGECHSEKEKP